MEQNSAGLLRFLCKSISFNLKSSAVGGLPNLDGKSQESRSCILEAASVKISDQNCVIYLSKCVNFGLIFLPGRITYSIFLHYFHLFHMIKLIRCTCHRILNRLDRYRRLEPRFPMNTVVLADVMPVHMMIK